ncbi:hypothetical protein LWI28_028297 [Acer negundo]|uniref:Reverse transcriptase domain-containing protein n=1 Tax=Acer negundo TaxID=4023 RepID=A0AAD5NK02_ACENE|nr:hypothetical protein LWI28_028297 [Acer negundo]
MCVDFTDLNKACSKDSFPLSRIDQLVNATAVLELLSFTDTYSGYNRIRMHEPEEEKMSFTTDQGLYCYTVMPFRLKNAVATYQRLVNRKFARQFDRNMEVYVDDMLTKSIIAERHVFDFETFNALRKYKMKLNLNKCVFGVPSGRFLGFQVHQRGIKVNPNKIKALANFKSPKTLKDIWRLIGCLASLNRFISKSVDKGIPYFGPSKRVKR